MNTPTVIVSAAAGVLVAAVATVAPASAIPPQEVTIKSISAECVGAKAFGSRPLVTLAGQQVSYAFEDKVACSTVRKVTKKTIDSSGDKGAKVNVKGYRCRATKVVDAQPTGGWTTWKCTFTAADTPTQISLKFRQYAD